MTEPKFCSECHKALVKEGHPSLYGWVWRPHTKKWVCIACDLKAHAKDLRECEGKEG